MDVRIVNGALLVDGMPVALPTGRYPDLEREVEGFDPSAEIEELEKIGELRLNAIERMTEVLEDIATRVGFIEDQLEDIRGGKIPSKVQLDRLEESLKTLREFATARAEAEGL